MRKLSILGSLLVVSMLTVGVSSASALENTFTFKLSPNRASKSNKDLSPIKKLTLANTFANGPDGSPPITNLVNIQFDSKAIIDLRALKGTAKFSQVENTGNCSSKYRIGSGKAVATVLPLIPVLNAKVNLCVVEKSPGSIFTVAVATKVDALGIVIALKAEIKAVAGMPLIVLDANLPVVVGITPRIQSLDVKVNRVKKRRVKGKRRYLLSLGIKCNKVWSATQTITFKDGTPDLVQKSEQKCKKAKKSKKKSKKK